VIGEDLLGSTLMEGETTGERIRGVIRDPQELADCRNVSFAARSVEAFGDVEDEVGTEQREPSGKAAVGLEAVDLTYRAERPLHRIDGGGLVPLGVEVWLREIGSEGPTGRLVG